MTLRMTEAEARKLGVKMPEQKRQKYNARKVRVDGIAFDSQTEANYYCRLKLLLRAGEIDGFCRQARFVVTYGQDGEKGTEYVTDFIVFLPDKTYRIVDVKGIKTRDFKLKMKSLREKYPRLKVELEE